jgi:hypothetical protein
LRAAGRVRIVGKKNFFVRERMRGWTGDGILFLRSQKLKLFFFFEKKKKRDLIIFVLVTNTKKFQIEFCQLQFLGNTNGLDIHKGFIV